MRTSGAVVLGVCILGALMGTAVVWLWGREMGAYVEEKTGGVRDGVREALRAGQDAIRPAPAATTT